LVDEFQDTSQHQFELVHTLTASSRRLTVVGDDAQSIYAFRGANVGNFGLFTNHYGRDAVVVELQQNYRSSGNIVVVASHLIKPNYDNDPTRKNMIAMKDAGHPVRLLMTEDASGEVNTVLQAIQQLNQQGVAFSDIAVLTRTRVIAAEFELEMKRKQIPYAFPSGTGLKDRHEVHTLLAYMTLALDDSHDEAFVIACNVPQRNITKPAVTSLTRYASTHRISLMTCARSLVFGSGALDGWNSGSARELAALRYVDSISMSCSLICQVHN